MSIPIIKLTVEHMQHSVAKALTEYAMQMDEDIQNAVKRVCTKEHVARVVEEEARRALDVAIAEEIRNFYHRGEGRKFVQEKIAELLNKGYL